MKNGVKTAFRVSAALFLVLAFTGSFAAPQTAPAAGPDSSALTSHLRWRSIGPANMVGRISDFEALDSDFTQVLVGSASGGVFKSVNAGTTWEPIFDRYGSASIGDVAFFQKDPNIIWVGTGEECVRNSVAWGDGIYKSTDGGKTFTRMGLETTQTIARVITHPTDPSSRLRRGLGPSLGLHGRPRPVQDDRRRRVLDQARRRPARTTARPGPSTWSWTRPTPNTLYVAFWQRLRQPWRFDSGGPNAGIFKTTDGGTTWTKLTQGLPAGELGRIGLAISRSNPKVLMAIVEATVPAPADGPPGDRPEAQSRVRGHDQARHGHLPFRGRRRDLDVHEPAEQPALLLQPHLHQSPRGQVDLLAGHEHELLARRRQDLEPGRRPPPRLPRHVDRSRRTRTASTSARTAAPRSPTITASTWVFFDNFTAAQFYAVSADMRDPYYVYGGLQDNGTWGGPSMHREGQILTDFWYNIGGGDGFHTQNDPQDWRTAYVESQGGAIQRVNVETRESKQIRPTAANIVNYKDYYPARPAGEEGPGGQARRQARGQAGAKPEPAGQEGGMPPGGRPDRGPFRFNWSTPIVLSPHNPETVFIGGTAPLQVGRPRRPLDDHQPRPDDERQDQVRSEESAGRAGPDRRDHLRRHRRRDLRHDHHHLRIAPRPRPDLGRDRRRQRPADPQRRRHLDQRPGRHQGRPARPVVQPGRGLALRRGTSAT